MDDLDVMPVSQHCLYWDVNESISYDMKKESFVDYLKKEKQLFDRPRPRWQRYLGILVLVIGTSGCLVSINHLVNLLVDIIQGMYEISPGDFFYLLGFPNEIIPLLTLGYLSAFAFTSIFFGLIFCYFLTLSKRRWSKFHEDFLALFERLNEITDIEKYIEYQEEKKRFQLIELSTDWDIEWVFPFLFRYFPPLLFQIGVIAIIFPIFIITLLPVINVMLTRPDLFELVHLVILGGYLTFLALVIGIFFMLGYQKWKRYDCIRIAMINKQKEKIHYLIIKKADESTIIRNQNNLARLIMIRPFPLPVLFRITMVFPLAGTIISYFLSLFA